MAPSLQAANAAAAAEGNAMGSANHARIEQSMASLAAAMAAMALFAQVTHSTPHEQTPPSRHIAVNAGIGKVMLRKASQDALHQVPIHAVKDTCRQ